MSLNFPSSPSPGDSFTAEGATFVWTGSVWVMPPSGLIIATQDEAEEGQRQDRAMTPLRGKQAIDALATPAAPQPPHEALCRAYCIFLSDGTIVHAVNVASVVVLGAGTYEVTFATPRPSANYVVLGSCEGITNHPVMAVASPPDFQTAAKFRVIFGPTGGNGSTGGFLASPPRAHVGVFAWD
jgi:hypothetical protein